MKIWKFAVTLAAAMALAGPACAASTNLVSLPPLSSGACSWTSAGAGPLKIYLPVAFNPVAYAISDSAPSGAGPFFPLRQDSFIDVQTTSNVYLCNYSTTAAVNVVVAPISGSTTIPTAATTTQGVVSPAPTAGTFLSALAANASRKGCTIINASSTTGYIYFGPTASATTSNSIPIPPQGGANCATGTGAVLTDNVAVTCASGTCAFVKLEQN